MKYTRPTLGSLLELILLKMSMVFDLASVNLASDPLVNLIILQSKRILKFADAQEKCFKYFKA